MFHCFPETVQHPDTHTHTCESCDFTFSSFDVDPARPPPDRKTGFAGTLAGRQALVAATGPLKTCWNKKYRKKERTYHYEQTLEETIEASEDMSHHWRGTEGQWKEIVISQISSNSSPNASLNIPNDTQPQKPNWLLHKTNRVSRGQNNKLRYYNTLW